MTNKHIFARMRRAEDLLASIAANASINRLGPTGYYSLSTVVNQHTIDAFFEAGGEWAEEEDA